eukprot:gene5180-10359_t
MTIGDEMVAKLESDCIITVSKPTVDRFPNISISHETNLIDCHVTSIWNKLWNVICCFVDDDSKRSLGSSSRGKGKLLLMENILRPHLKHNKSLNDSTENEITMRIRDGNRLALNNWKAEVNEDFEVYKDFVVVSPYSEDGKRNNGKDSAYFAKLNDLWKLISRQKMLITDGTYSRVPQLQLEDIVRPGIASGYQFNTSFQQAAIPSGYTSDPYISIQLENILRPGIDSGGIVISLQPWAMIDGFLGPSSDDPPTPQRSIEQQRVINRRIAYKLTKKASKSLNPFLKRNQNELFLYLESFSLSMDISMRKFQKILIGESISTVDQKPMLEAIHKAGLDRFEDPSDFIWNQLRLHEKDMKKMEIKARKLRKIRIFRVSKNVENDRKLEETIERSELPPANESFSFYIKYYTNFFEAHNQNVNAFNNILENPPLFCKESKALSFDQYSTKLKSDIIMKKAVQLRHEIERKIADLRMRIRFELINEKNISPVYLQSPYYVEKFKRINFKRLRSQIRKNDSNDNSDVLAERIYEKRRWSVACGRPVEDFEAGVDINVDVNVNVKDRKLTSSPTRSMPEEDSCTVSFDFLTMKVQLSVIRAGKLLEDFIPLDNMFALTFDNEMNNNIENNTENYKQNGYTQKLEFGLVCINKINNSLEGINNYFKIHTQNTIQIKKTLASIIPSIITPPRKFSEVYKELLRSDILMKYATRYRHEIQNKVSKLRSRARCAIFGQDDDTPTYFQSLIFLNKYKRINFKRRKRIIPNFEPNEDGIYERRRWIAGYGESDLDSSLTCRQVPGVPIYMPFTEVTPQEALQWVFCIHHDSTYDRYSMPKNDSCTMIFDFMAMEIRISVLRLGYVLKETFSLDKLYMISAVNPEQTLEISLLDDISYEKLTLEKKDKTYLHWAIKTNNIESVFVVIDRVKDINATDKSGYTALHLACMGNHKNIVLKLIELKANLNLYDRQLNTALHLAVAQKNFDIIRILIANDADATLKNKENKIPFESFPDESSRQFFFIDQEHTLEEFKAHNYHLWFYFIQIQDITGIEDKVLQYVQLYLFLAYAKDGHGRVACDMATPSNKAVINSVFLWHGRFRVTEARPEHTSATCFVFKGYDEDNKDDTGNACPVALKLMRVKKHFLREISARDRGFDNEYVIDILERYPKTNEELDKWPEITAQDTAGLVSLNKIQAESFFCIVMPLANRNMFVALKQERFAGRNMEEVRHIFIQLVNCVQHMHERGVLHADIKTLNIVRVETQWKLIDMDATCIIGQDPVGFKSSSAYIPPETIYIDPIDSTARVRSSAVPVPVSVPVHVVSDASINIAAVPYNNSVYELILAHPSFDVWSLGCILFQMCNIDVRPLFQGGQDDNLSDDITEDDNLHPIANKLVDTIRELKVEKLSKSVTNSPRGSVSGPGTDKMVEALHREISRLEKELKEKSSTIVPLPSLEIDIDKVKELDKDVAIAFLTDRLHACGEEIKELRAVLERFTRQAATDSVCSSSSSLSPRSSRIDIHRAVLSAREASTDVLNMKLELLHKENIALKEEIRIMKERLDNINM